MKIQINNTVRDMTPEEEAFTIQDRQNVQADLAVEEETKAQLATDKASGNQKLLDLGLSQAEATALTNYTPPVED